MGESIRDTLMDLASYALIAICLLEEELKLLEEETASHPTGEHMTPGCWCQAGSLESKVHV